MGDVISMDSYRNSREEEPETPEPRLTLAEVRAKGERLRQALLGIADGHPE